MTDIQKRLSQAARRKLTATHRQRVITWLLTLLLALFSVAVVLSCIAMLTDWTFSIRAAGIRWILSLAVLAAVIQGGWWCSRKLKAPSGLSATATWLDRNNPRLEERLTTTVELEERAHCSEELLNAVSKQVDDIAFAGRPTQMLRGPAFRYVLAGFAVACVMLGVLAVVCGPSSHVLVTRLLSPWGKTTLTQLPDTLQTQPHRKGLDLAIALPIEGKIPRKAKLQQREADGVIEERWVQVEPGSGMVTSLIQRVQADFAYRVVAGDDQTPWNEVTVFDYPRMEELSLRMIPPAYTGLPERSWKTLPRQFTAPEGSAIQLRFRADQALAAASLVEKIKNVESIQILPPEDGNQYTHDRTLAQTLHAELQLAAAYGNITSRFPIAMIALPDQKPRVQLAKESETFALTADETLDIRFRASDDYGIAHAELVAQLENADGQKEEIRFPIELGDQTDQKKVEATFALDLKQLPIKPGTRLSYAVEVRDRRGETAQGESREIAEQPPNSQEFARLQQAIDQIEDLQQALMAAQDSNDQALEALGTPPTGEASSATSEETAGKNEQASERSARTQDLLKEAARLAADVSGRSPAKDDLVAKPIGRAQASVEQAQSSEHPAAPLTEAGKHMAEAQAALDALRKQIEQHIAQAEAEQAQPQLDQLRNALAAAQAMASEAQRLNQEQSASSNQAGRPQQAGSPQQAGNPQPSGSPQQPPGSPQQAGSPQPSDSPQQVARQNPKLEASLDALKAQLDQSQAAARKLSPSEVNPSVAQAIENANAAATEAKQNPDSRSERLDTVEREIEQALANLDEAASDAPPSDPSQGQPPPPGIEVAKRDLDMASNCSCSGSAQVTVDEYATYLIPGEAQRKQSLAIKSVLEQIRERAETARKILAEVQAVEGRAEAEPDPVPGEKRTWTSRNGKTGEASFIRVEGDYAVFSVNGRQGRIPIAHFIDADQAWIRKQAGKPFAEQPESAIGQVDFESFLSVKAADAKQEAFLKAFADRNPDISETLKQGIAYAEQLRKVSEDTPYAYFGLQARSLVENGFEPALEYLWEGITLTDPDALRHKIELADERLRWVTSFLDKSEKQFQEMIEMEEVAQLTHAFRKMHNITIEDLPALLGIEGAEGENDKSRYPKLKNELSDQAVQEVIAGLKLKREVLKRLAELMQKDPFLRARLLAQSQESKKIYREELTRLRNRQVQLATASSEVMGSSRILVEKPDPSVEEHREAPAVFPALNDLMQRRMLALANQAETAIGNARIWLTREPLDDLRATLEEHLSGLSTATDKLTTGNPLDAEAMKAAEAAFQAAREQVTSTLSDARDSQMSAEFITFREEDIDALAEEVAQCSRLTEFLRKEQNDRFLAQVQKELNRDTRRTTVGLLDALSSISDVEPGIDNKITALEILLVQDLFGSQGRALTALENHDPKTATSAQQQAYLELEAAVKLLDEALVDYVRAQSENESPPPPEGSVPLPDPTESDISAALQALLRKLEQEAREEMDPTLGLSEQTNLKITRDWRKTAEQKEKERREMAQRRQQQKQKAQQALRLAAQAQHMANQRAEQLARGLRSAPKLPWKDRQLEAFNGRNDWNNLPSQLQESITQEFDPSVPAEHREAIKRYFRLIAEANQP